MNLSQYGRLRSKRSSAGPKALVAVETPGRNKLQPAHPKFERVSQHRRLDGESPKWGTRGHRGDECRGGKENKMYDSCSICGGQDCMR